MEDLGINVNSSIDGALETVLRGKETPEEREDALIKFIKDYDKSTKELECDLRIRATIKANVLIVVAFMSVVLGSILTILVMK